MAGERVVIIGAGWAGLSAAFHLIGQGYQVTVLEHTPRVGGRAFSFPVPNRKERLDNGQHVLLGLCTDFTQLLSEAGMGSTVAFQPLLHVPVISARRSSRLGSARLRGPLHLAPAVARYGLLSVGERMRVMALGLGIARQRDPDRWDGVSWSEWLRSHGQSDKAQRVFWDAVGTGILNAKADEVSAALALKTFQMLLQKGWQGARMGLFTRPLSDAADGMRQYLTKAGVVFHMGCRVDVIEHQNNRVWGVRGGQGEWSADAVIAAVPPNRLVPILRASQLTQAVPVPAITYSPIVNTYLWYDRPVWSGQLALLVDDMGAMVFNRSGLIPTQSGEGQTLGVSLSAARSLRSWTLEEITDRVDAVVQQRLHVPRADAGRSVRQVHATFLGVPGLETQRPPQRTSVEGLYLAGDWTDTGWPACLEGAVKSGARAARLLMHEISVSGLAP